MGEHSGTWLSDIFSIWDDYGYEQPQAKWNVPATYKVKGAVRLGDTDWPEVTKGNKGLFRFFKVELVLP